VALVLALRQPATWSFIGLTKPTVAVVGMWHLFRREWRQAGIALVTTLGVVAISVMVGADLWVAWFERMRGDTGTAGPAWIVSLAVRILLALLIVWFAARRRRPIFLPVAAFLALPIPWAEGLTLLAAIPRLARIR
jgi:hypothetical protein